jgi:hypothetical protein
MVSGDGLGVIASTPAPENMDDAGEGDPDQETERRRSKRGSHDRGWNLFPGGCRHALRRVCFINVPRSRSARTQDRGVSSRNRLALPTNKSHAEHISHQFSAADGTHCFCCGWQFTRTARHESVVKDPDIASVADWAPCSI